MTSYPKPRLIKNPSAQWEQPEKVNWTLWIAIVFAIAAVLVGATADIWAIPSGAGPSPYGSSPQAVSPVPASVPIATE